MIYLDSSALLKLVFREVESSPLRTWLQRAEDTVVSSELAKVEVLVSTRRLDPTALPLAREVVAGLDLLALSGAAVEIAAETELQLRSLDALHLASAQLLGTELSSFVAYDQRLIEAAESRKLTVITPR